MPAVTEPSYNDDMGRLDIAWASVRLAQQNTRRPSLEYGVTTPIEPNNRRRLSRVLDPRRPSLWT